MSSPTLPSGLLLITLSTCVFILGPSPAHAVSGRHVPKQQMKQQIADLEQQWRTATLNADLSLMDKLLSEDYVGIAIGGQVNTKAMQLDRLRRRSLVIRRMDLSDLHIKLVGSVAIVTSLATIEGMNEGAELNGIFRYTRVYQRLTSGVWKITNFEATRVRDPVQHAQSDVRPTSSP